MLPTQIPLLEPRQAPDFLAEMLERALEQFPQWKAKGVVDRETALRELEYNSRNFGVALLKLAAHMGELTASQLNRIPEKVFLAFLEFIGTELKAPTAARAPLTFMLVDKAPEDGVVPKGTRIGAFKRDNVIFETEDNLVVTRMALNGAYSVDLQKDRYVDLSNLLSLPDTMVTEIKREVFADSAMPPEWPQNVHAIYLGHDTLFTWAEQAGEPVEIIVSMQNDESLPDLTWEYFTDEGWKPTTAAHTRDATENYTLSTSGIVKSIVQGHSTDGQPVSKSGYWLRACSLDAKPVTITDIQINAQIGKNIAPGYLVYFNNVVLDSTKDFLPFGERPQFNDTFYIANQTAFAKPGAAIEIEVTLTKSLPTTIVVGLVWEYWDGAKWAVIGRSDLNGDSTVSSADQLQFSDTTAAFTKDGNVTFICPIIRPYKVNDIEDYWLRIRIVNGGYGQDAGYQETANEALLSQLENIETDSDRYAQILQLLTENGLVNTYQYVESTYTPPSIKSLQINYSINTTEPVSQRLTENNFIITDESTSESFQPFFAWNETEPPLYLEIDAASAISGTPMSIYIKVVQPRYGMVDASNAIGSDSTSPAVVWRYWNGIDWSRLPAEDETYNLTRSGMLKFIFPNDAVTRYLFGKQDMWIKASLESGGYFAPPKLAGVYINTVWARHGISFRDQVLGSSNGNPGQQFRFPKQPVLEGQIAEVRENTLPTDAEQKQIIANEGKDAVRLVKDAAGNIAEVWVRWHRVSSLSLSGPADRHYIIDRASGVISFGDGEQGFIPPAGKNNIVARAYTSGGGREGTSARGSLTELKTTLPFIDSVNNFDASYGADDQETIDSVVSSGPLRIKSRDRAVTAEDYEWLAKEASSDVVKARCLPLTRAQSVTNASGLGNDPGWVTLIIVPRGEEDQPLPTDELINSVKQYLTQRTLATLANQVDVIGAHYVTVNVTAQVIPEDIDEAKAVERRVFENLKAFLHPLSGGPDGVGWTFGRDIFLSEIAAVVQGTDGVDQVRSLYMTTSNDTQPRNRIEIGVNDLPASGRHTVVAVGGEA